MVKSKGGLKLMNKNKTKNRPQDLSIYRRGNLQMQTLWLNLQRAVIDFGCTLHT